ncbi:hypothetical protein WH5701_11014 [Synechococcus sp. WH 5701]|nr:hypothetical protein WH5701_11014 [Synechococcus sp. WH 5701]
MELGDTDPVPALNAPAPAEAMLHQRKGMTLPGSTPRRGALVQPLERLRNLLLVTVLPE